MTRHASHANGLNHGQTHREVGTQSQRICGDQRRPPGCRIDGDCSGYEVLDVKPNLARLTWAVATVARYSWVILILASLALSLGAGIKWDLE
jgi:phage shock protein PspC (stress-responsive transcriptional regulator)